MFKPGQISGRFSNAIWGSMPDELAYDRNVGVFKCEDFDNFGQSALVADNVGWYVGSAGPYKTYEDTAAVVKQLPTARGRLSIATAATNNNEVWLQSCSGTGILGAITAGAAGRKQWFEARVAVNQIVTQNLFVGMAEEGLAATNTVDDSGVFADKDYHGFQVVEGAAATLTYTYKKAGQTAQVPIAALTTLVADTFVNLGWIYDPTNIRRLRIFLNGSEQATYLTAANIAAATFPSGEEMSFLFGGKNANAANTYFCEGWAFGQLTDRN